MTSPHHELTHEGFAGDLDEQADPHGFSKGHQHGHVILSLFTLRSVLVTLLLFTAVTVSCARGEKWFDATFGATLPHWVNVVGAMGIATIKSVIVAAFFMQLKYDNPINSAIFMFCLLVLAIFLGLTALDLGMRDRVYAYKAVEVQAGGLGNIQRTIGYEADGTPIKEAISVPLYRFAGEQLREKVGEKRFQEIRAEVMGHGHHGPVAAPKPTNSTADQSRSRLGPTPGLYDTTVPAHGPGEGAQSH